MKPPASMESLHTGGFIIMSAKEINTALVLAPALPLTLMGLAFAVYLCL